jgi:hypothetical protein
MWEKVRNPYPGKRRPYEHPTYERYVPDYNPAVVVDKGNYEYHPYRRRVPVVLERLKGFPLCLLLLVRPWRTYSMRHAESAGLPEEIGSTIVY